MGWYQRRRERPDGSGSGRRARAAWRALKEGISAAATRIATRPRPWATRPSGPAGHRIAEYEDPAGDRGEVGGGAGDRDHRNRSPSWKDFAEAKKATTEASSVSASQGLSSPKHPVRADDPGQRLDRDVGDAEQDPARRAEHRAVVLARCAGARADDQQRPDAAQRGLDGDHRGRREARVGTAHRGHRQREGDQARWR